MPCLSIHNIVHTSRGDISAKHIVHATNGWTSHLLAPVQEKIVPVCVHMTAQRAGTGLDDGWLGTQSFVLYQARLRIDGTISPSSPPALRHSERNPTQSLCLAVASRWAPRPSLTLLDVLMTSFECRLTLVGYSAREYVTNSITPDVNGAFVIKEILQVNETDTHRFNAITSKVEPCCNYTPLRFSLYTTSNNGMSTRRMYQPSFSFHFKSPF
ncbi:hypothetical protein ARMGADRAFT_101118 [Armillaria gallica]|uniref:FAD dependent oxidoreductase domain-containing protein n=1 Tax=Armillaria gallica TaxID=47427 RepID=A0A2H3C9U6_ARMGA|nr:hypothetical protein ARMGADRAFT_101118 [Armillaria gallica]